jgi:triphosphoribosyl-dephospho-CoA synthetase
MEFVPPSCRCDIGPHRRGETSERDISREHFATAWGALAAIAVYEEVMLSPKPGLVCPDSNGSHSDMNWTTFVIGASALVPFWRAQAFCGAASKHYKPSASLLDDLRNTGLKMEAAMYKATGGINTHKGLIFALSLLLGASGANFAAGGLSMERVLGLSGEIVSPIVGEELGNVKAKEERGERLTNGEKIFLRYGVGGIRKEAASGFPSVRAGVEALDEAVSAGASFRDAAVSALLILMLKCEDTNVIHRGGMKFWSDEYKEMTSGAIKKFNPVRPGLMEPVHELDRLLIERGVSPGGAADLLACTLFMYRSKISDNTFAYDRLRRNTV